MSDEQSKEFLYLKQRVKELEHAAEVEATTGSFRDVAESEIDLKELFSVLWSGKWIIIGITTFFSICSILYALSLPNLYKSTVILAPVESKSGGLGSLAAQYGGLAAMAGINLGSSGGSQVDEAVELLTSWPFLEEVINNNHLKPLLIAANSWDKKNNVLLYDRATYNPETEEWLVDANKYSSWRAYEAFRNKFNVSKDKQSGLVNISIEYYSPYLAKTWVDMIVVKLNDYYQQRAIEETQRNIEFLSKKASQTSISEMRTMFYSLIEEQTKSLMLASLNEEYLLKTVVPSMSSEVKSNPKRALISFLGFITGLFFGLILVLIKNFMFNETHKKY